MFSIIIPLYNKSHYIIRCLKSVFSQKYKDFEVIVINDGSTDNSAEIILENFPNVQLINQENQGVSAARNKGILLANRSYVAFLDADDAWHPDYLSFMYAVIQQNQHVKMIGSHYGYEKEILVKPSTTLSYYRIENYFEIAIKNTLFTSSSTVIKKNIIDKNEVRFNILLKTGEDLDFWFRINAIEGNSFYITNTLMYYSDDDTSQATRTLPNIENTLVGTALSSYKTDFENNLSFSYFIDLYVLFNLYPYFYRDESRAKAADLLKQIKGQVLLKLAYKIPFFIGRQIIKKKLCIQLLRLYLKFIIRHKVS